MDFTFNRYGIDGLTHNHERPGRPTKIPLEKHEELKDLIRNPYQVGEDFWTARKLHGYLSEKWQAELGYSTLCANMHKLGFRLKVPQSWSGERQDEKLREQFRIDLEHIKLDFALVAVCGVGWLRQAASETFFNIENFIH